MKVSEEFARRRQQLIESVPRDSIIILPTADEANRNNDVDYPYRPDSDFLYLTGFWEPEAVLVIVPGRGQGEYLLFNRKKDKDKEIWHGFRHGQQGAKEVFGANEAYAIDELDEQLPPLLENKNRIYYTMGRHAEFDTRIMDWINVLRMKARQGINVPKEFICLEHLLHEQRLIKSPQEIEWMKQAAEISTRAHKRAMQNCQPGKFEYHLEGEIIHEFYQHGCRHDAYPSIVGGGKNACTLHYTENDSVLNSGDLVLIDAGVEYQGYASDITRTFPVSGRFSEAQAQLYELVLQAQQAAMQEIKPGNHWNEPHHAVLKVLTRGLVELGLIKGDGDDDAIEQLIADEAYKPFFMHKTGHWLGLDVHDVGDYKVDGEWREFQPGMALTVEPGLYVSEQDGVDEKWWNIGIRIEDDVIVTETGCEVLTQNMPKSIQDIEQLMASSD